MVVQFSHLTHVCSWRAVFTKESSVCCWSVCKERVR
uniref:Uncharacterized protein n=1 Tax=Rhizophora mucronata TaxID=61149 RepID=A0A2P2MAJ5_RHIMU